MHKTATFILAVLVISTLFSVIGGEFIVRGIAPQITYKQARAVGLRVFQPSDVVPFTLKSNLQTNHLGYTREFDHKVRINNLGVRGNDTTLQKPSETFRILILGDSMTFGWGVEDEQTFPYRLQEYVNRLGLAKKVEVINAGFASGYSPDSYYAFMRTRGVEFEPDLVVVAFFPNNDISDLLEMDWVVDESGYPVAVQSLDKTARDGYQVFRTTSEWKYVIPVVRDSHLMMLIFQAMERNTPDLVEAIKRVFRIQPPPQRTTPEAITSCLYQLSCDENLLLAKEKVKFIFKGLSELLGKRGIGLAVAIIPLPEQAKKVAALPSPVPLQQPQAEFVEYLQTLSVPVIDLLPQLVTSEVQGYFYGRDGHLTSKGTEVVAKALAYYLSVTQPSLLDNLAQGVTPEFVTEKLLQ